MTQGEIITFMLRLKKALTKNPGQRYVLIERMETPFGSEDAEHVAGIIKLPQWRH